MTKLRLDAANCEHEAASGVAPIGAKRHHPRHVESGCDLAGCAEFDFVAKVYAHEGRMDEGQAVAERHAHVIHKFKRRRPSTAFGAIHHDEVRRDAGVQHGFDHGHEFPGMTNTKLEAYWFAARKLTQLRDELHHFYWRLESSVPCR